MVDGTTTVGALRTAVRRFVRERDWERFHLPKDLAIAISVEASELLEQEIQGVVVARVVRVPQSDRVEPRKARGLFTPQNPDLGLDRLEAADESEAPQRMEQVEMDLVQRHPRKCLPEERDVEPCAVERDEEFRSSHRGGEVFEVVPLDKGAFPRAVEHPDHGDRIPADREARRLDVEERDCVPELAPRPPMAAW